MKKLRKFWAQLFQFIGGYFVNSLEGVKQRFCNLPSLPAVSDGWKLFSKIFLPRCVDELVRVSTGSTICQSIRVGFRVLPFTFHLPTMSLMIIIYWGACVHKNGTYTINSLVHRFSRFFQKYLERTKTFGDFHAWNSIVGWIFLSACYCLGYSPSVGCWFWVFPEWNVAWKILLSVKQLLLFINLYLTLDVRITAHSFWHAKTIHASSCPLWIPFFLATCHHACLLFHVHLPLRPPI